MADMFFDDATYDLVIQGGDLKFTSDVSFVETMRQRIKAALQVFLGEWFLDDKDNPGVGLPYFQSLFVDKIPSMELADTIFRTALSQVEGVTEVETIEFDIQGRDLYVGFRVLIDENGNVVEDVVSFAPLMI